MTNEEAVNWLINITADIGKAEHRDLWHYEQALSEIRTMFEAQPEKRTKTHACDLIDRQALMKEFSDFVRASNNSDFAPTPTWNDAVSLVGSMPSAQSTMGQVFDDDCVSRQAAIDALENTKEVAR